MFKKIYAKMIAAAAYLAAVAIFSSCDDIFGNIDPLPKPEESFSLTLPKPTVANTKDSQFLTIKAQGDWTMTLDFPEDTQYPWATLKKTEGTGSGLNTLYWEANYSAEQRTVDITLVCGKDDTTVTLTQLGQNVYINELKSDPVHAWLELPATNDPSRYFITHEMTLGTFTTRNYSFYLDPSALVAVWVAYPLNRGLISSGSRTDAWGLDPKVPRQYQSVIGSAYKGGYQRGHQLPSADRYAHDANVATFYGTNMTPQIGSLNEEGWAALEGKVRNWCYKVDTLYVVTGADIKGSTKVAYDNDGKAVTVPVGYFKALLAYKKNATSTQMPSQVNGYVGVGFYYKHEACPTDHDIMARSMTLNELEEKTGFDFFVNLPDNIENQVESTVSTWWKNNL